MLIGNYNLLTLGTHVHEGYGNHFVCVCLCVCFHVTLSPFIYKIWQGRYGMLNMKGFDWWILLKSFCSMFVKLFAYGSVPQGPATSLVNRGIPADRYGERQWTSLQLTRCQSEARGFCSPQLLLYKSAILFRALPIYYKARAIYTIDHDRHVHNPCMKIVITSL